jgi:DNA-binding NarL/FixJ family response regulator
MQHTPDIGEVRDGARIRIAIAEDHHVVRQGLRLLLEMESDFSLVGEAADGLETVRMVEHLKPDLLLLDLMLPKLHGAEVTRQLKGRAVSTKILILSMHSDEAYILAAMRNGADGYVLKNENGGELIRGIRKVLAGERYLSPTLTTRPLALDMKPSEGNVQDLYETLSNRERTVLQMTAEGISNAEIANKLLISQRTVETHRANLMQKLFLHSQTDLVRFAIRKGIIAP